MAAALTVAAALPLTGCSSGGGYTPELKSPTVSSPAIGQDGTLRVGVNTDQSPLAGRGNDKIIGIDVDIAAALADRLGLKLSIVDVGSDPEGALAEGKVDLVMGIDQSEGGDFWLSSAYLPTGVAAFATSPDAGVPTAGGSAKFAAQISSKSAWAVTNEFGEGALTSTDSLSEAFQALKAGTVQYVAADAIIGLYAAHGVDDGLDVSIVAMLMKPSGYCMAVASANTDLQTAAGDVLANLAGNGTISVIERKWLGTAVALDDLTVIDETTPVSSSDDGSGDGNDGSGEEGAGDGSDGDGAGDDGASGEGDGSGDGSGGDTGDEDTE